MNEDKVSKPALQLCLLSKTASKSAIAAVATSLARSFCFKQRKGGRFFQPNDFSLKVDALDAILEGRRVCWPVNHSLIFFVGEDGLSSPDFMIVHPLSLSSGSRKRPLELHCFPPWHIRLTEIQYVYSPLPSITYTKHATFPQQLMPLR